MVGPGQDHTGPKESQVYQSQPFHSCFVLGSGIRHKRAHYVLCFWAVGNCHDVCLNKLRSTSFQKYFFLIFRLFGDLYKQSNAFFCPKFLKMPAVLRAVSCNAGGGKKVNQCNYWILMWDSVCDLFAVVTTTKGHSFIWVAAFIQSYEIWNWKSSPLW